MRGLNIEKKIRFYLGAKNMSIKKFCKEIGMSQQNLDRIFKANSINTTHLQKMAKVFNIEISYFFLSDEQIEILNKEVDVDRIKELKELNFAALRLSVKILEYETTGRINLISD